MVASVNIIGFGYVGGAIGHLCRENQVPFNVCDVVDKPDSGANKSFTNISQLVSYCDAEVTAGSFDQNVYIVCVPTPSDDKTGKCDTSIVSHVLETIQKAATTPTHIIIKSTVKPGTCREFYTKFVKNYVISLDYWPEFLREKTFMEDMYNADFALIGSNTGAHFAVVDTIESLYKHKRIRVIQKKYEDCEIFKYTINVFLSVKVWFFNEMHDICDKFSVKYKDVQDLLHLDARVGLSHTDVPGHDGQRGFGGKCLPKETIAMCNLQQELGLDDSVLRSILKRNSEWRNDI